MTLAETPHYSEAAEKLYITQQALSKNIKQLEKNPGFTLFQRTGRTQTLTLVGQQFLFKARTLLSELQKIETHFQSHSVEVLPQKIRITAPDLASLAFSNR